MRAKLEKYLKELVNIHSEEVLWALANYYAHETDPT